MSTKTEIIEAGARALFEVSQELDQDNSWDDPLPDDWRQTWKDAAEEVITEALPLIKQQLVAELEAEGYKRDVLMTPDEVDLVQELVGIVERLEL